LASVDILTWWYNKCHNISCRWLQLLVQQVPCMDVLLLSVWLILTLWELWPYHPWMITQYLYWAMESSDREATNHVIGAECVMRWHDVKVHSMFIRVSCNPFL